MFRVERSGSKGIPTISPSIQGFDISSHQIGSFLLLVLLQWFVIFKKKSVLIPQTWKLWAVPSMVLLPATKRRKGELGTGG